MIEERKIPNYFLHFTIAGIDDVLGPGGLAAILNVTGLVKFKDFTPPNDDRHESDAADVSRLVGGVIDLLGHNGAKAILRRAGRRGWRLSVDANPELMTGLAAELKKLPGDRERIAAIMGAITYDANRIFGEGHQELVPLEDGFEVRIADCEWCWGIEAAPWPVCFAEIGLEQEAILWATGRNYEVSEVRCRAEGADRCVFRIDVGPAEEGLSPLPTGVPDGIRHRTKE
jgi:predicted hydrocarbon binding protein